MTAASPLHGERGGEASRANPRSSAGEVGPTHDPGERIGTVAKLTFSLSNTIMGAGILGLPAAFGLCGSVLGTVLLVVFGGLSAFGLHLLSCCAMLEGPEKYLGTKQSFRSVATLAAPQFASLIDAAVAIKCFGVATSYLIVVGDTMPSVATEIFVDTNSMFATRMPWILGFSAASSVSFVVPSVDEAFS